MRIKLDRSSFRRASWYEYLLRFVFGGLITAIAGIVAKEFGPGVGGVFLAYPSILPASATLIEKHEKENKQRRGLAGVVRGRKAASVDAAGAAMGSIGLLAFALVVWQFLPNHGTWTVLSGATLLWLGVSLLCWVIRKHT